MQDIARILTSAAALLALASMAHAEPTVIELTQTGCQFLQSEGGLDHGYKTEKYADCEAINAKSGADRLAKATPIALKPGKYIFRVSNKNVPYELGFWIRETDYNLANPVHKLTKTSVSGGGLTLGQSKDYEVEIEAGKSYIYSCPLNPTPNYSIMVN